MKQKRFSVEQIVAVLKQAEAGVPLAELLAESVCPSRPSIDGKNSMWGWKRIKFDSSNNFKKKTPD